MPLSIVDIMNFTNYFSVLSQLLQMLRTLVWRDKWLFMEMFIKKLQLKLHLSRFLGIKKRPHNFSFCFSQDFFQSRQVGFFDSFYRFQFR